MAREYYYLVAGLPDLFLDQERKDFNLIKLKEEMQELLHPDDYYLVELIHLEYDNYNFLNYLLNRKLEYSLLGKFQPELYDEFEENFEQLPSYVQSFYNAYKGKGADDDMDESVELSSGEKQEKSPEVQFMEYFYRYISQYNNRFIRKWYDFNRDLNNILSAISCRKLGAEIAPQMVGGGELVETLTRSQSPDFGLKKDIDYLEDVLQIAETSDILERERKIDFLKWEIADDIITFDYFSIEVILAFFVKAGMVYRWLKLDKEVGAEMFKKLVDDLRKTYELPKEFAK